MQKALTAINSGANQAIQKTEIFFDQGVNRASVAHVVVPSQEFSSMNTTHMLNAWPEDERDRKRAPARF